MADLSVRVCNLQLSHPVMTAAGPPVRNGAGGLACAAGGASALVTKTISIAAAEVPQPNMADFRAYFLNTELWSELSPEQWIETEYSKVRSAGVPVIVSLGYTAAEIAALAPRVLPFADALELSTHYIGEDVKPMQDAIRAAKDATGLPVLLKLSPFRDIQEAASAAQTAGADGIVAINSFGPTLAIDIENGGRLWMGGKGYGWLSGPALKPIAMRAVYAIARSVDIPVIAVGGVSRGVDVIEFLMAGATAVQVCTAAITKGLTVFGKIAQEVDAWLNNHGYRTIAETRGMALQRAAPVMDLPPVVNTEACTGCGLCVTSCVYHALNLHNKKIQLTPDLCAACGLCLSRCPTNALRMPG